MELPRRFGLGLAAFVGTWLWLVVPTVLLLHTTEATLHVGPAGVACGLVLALLLGIVPWLQVHGAVEGNWRALLAWRAVADRTRRAPFAWLLSLILLYASAIPLFLFTLRYKHGAPRLDLGWDLALVSIGCGLPGRAAVGWAYARATTRPPAPRWVVWPARLAALGGLAFFVYLLALTPLTHYQQPLSLIHHELLLPFP